METTMKDAKAATGKAKGEARRAKTGSAPSAQAAAPSAPAQLRPEAPKAEAPRASAKPAVVPPPAKAEAPKAKTRATASTAAGGKRSDKAQAKSMAATAKPAVVVSAPAKVSLRAAKPAQAPVPATVAAETVDLAAAVTASRTASRAAPAAPEPQPTPPPNRAGVAAPAATAWHAGVEGSRRAFEQARESGEALRRTMPESTAAAMQGFVALNGQMLDLFRAQSEATFALWRATWGAGSLSEAIRAQASGLRQMYETSASHWRAIAETATRMMGGTPRPPSAASDTPDAARPSATDRPRS